MTSYQRSLFDACDAPALDGQFQGLVRTHLSWGAWLDHTPRWVRGHEALFETLLADADWQETEQQLYERTLITPRLVANLPERSSALPLIADMQAALCARYGQIFSRVALALYRDGRDSVAFHGDRVARELPEALVATVTLGAGRRFLLRPRTAAEGEPRRSLGFQLGGGDLVVMGGSCQRTWQHGIPKVKHAGARIALMFRPVWTRSPFQGNEA